MNSPYGRTASHRGVVQSINAEVNPRPRIEHAFTGSASSEAQSDFDRFFNLLTDLACIVSTDGYFKKVNPAWERTLGFTQEEVLSTPMLEFIHPDDLERTVSEVRKQSKEYRTSHFVNRYRCKNGSYRLLEWTTTFNRDESTRFGVARDITEQRLSEERLRESEERFRIMSDTCPTIIWVTDAQGRTRLANRTCREHFGQRFEQAEDQQSRLLIHPDDHDTYVGKFLAAVRDAAPFRAEARVLRSNGEWRWIASHAEPRRSQNGDFLGHVGISPDITDRKLSETALQSAKDAAESANRSKSEFLANMSHEIRTPMNGIIGLTDLALDTVLDAEQRGYLEGVKFSADSLLRILNDILDFSKIEAGKLAFEVIDFDLRRTLAAAIELNSIRSNAKNLNLVSECAAQIPQILRGDPGRLRQILINLIGNAVKFTDHGQVAVQVEQSGETACDVELHFSIADTGIGIPLDKQKHVFSAFTQADYSSTRKFGGTGLGLTISSQLVGMMGGRIWLDSEEGKGSTFHFTICLAKSPECAVPVSGAQIGPRTPDVSQPPAPSVSRMRMLLVEDNPINRLVATRLLEKQNHVVRVAANGREAMEIIDREEFDYVLMDVQMPILDGFETTAAIRSKERERGGHLPIIAMTAHAMSGDVDRCLAAGMDGYLTKPINPPDVLKVVERVLADLEASSKTT